MRNSEDIKQELQKQLHLEIVQEIDNGEDSRPHIYKVKEDGESWFVKVVEIPGRVVANLSALSTAEKADIYQELKLDQRDPKYNELDMWWRVRKNNEYGKEYILGFYKHELLRWETKDMLGVDLVLFMTEAECLVDRLEKYSSNDPSKVEDEATVLKIGMDICKALIAMESEGVYHRDIKPGNIYFYNGNYVLGDFGISVSRNQKRSSWPRQFTASYCAPAQRKTGGGDHRGDIYSLGLVLFELSYPEWAGKFNARLCGVEDKKGDSAEKLLPDISGSEKLNEVIHKACRVDEKLRYANAREMLKALEVAAGYDSAKTEVAEEGNPYGEDDILPQMSDIDDEMLWDAGKFWYESSRAEGNRFEKFEIDEKLMKLMSAADQKEAAKKLPIHVYEEESEQTLLLEDIILKSGDSHIYLVGEGGIGKTTALYSIMEKAYKDNKSYDARIKSIPLFIELSKAPDEYKKVYKEGRSTFIRRCIMMQMKAQMSGEKFQLDRDIFEMEEKDVVKPVERLLCAVDAPVQYVLLLDGLNEVSVKQLAETKMSVMEMIIEEINQLKDKRKYPKVKLILTGRSDEYIVREDIVRYHLTGVKDVIGYLQANHIETVGMKENERLLGTLKNPLFLKLYCQVSSKENVATPGEILYAFFNEHKKNLETYTVKSRIEQIEQDLKSVASVGGEKRIDARMQYFILDFLLPEIGWYMERNNLYFLDIENLQMLISAILNGRKENDICGKNGKAVFNEYNSGIGIGSDTEKCAELLLKLGTTERESVEMIVSCCISSFGILYKNNSQFGFIHQHIRDYFAAMRIINNMRMALYAKNEKDCMMDFNNVILGDEVVRIIGEILGEYYNASKWNDGEWESTVPQEKCKRTMLTDCIDLYRNVFFEDDEINYGVRNLLEIMYQARGELCACDLSKLDLRFCVLNNIDLYNTDFIGSLLQEDTIFPNGHRGTVQKAVYSQAGEYIVSCGDDGCVKMWHARTKQYIKTIVKYPSPVTNIGFSNNGQYFFSATVTRVDIMDAVTFKVQRTFKNAYNAVFSPNSELIAIVYKEKIQMIELSSYIYKGELGKYHSHNLPKTPDHFWLKYIPDDICFSPDSKKIVYGVKEHIEMWDAYNCKRIGIFKESQENNAVHFSSNGKYIAWSTTNGIVICKSDPNVQEPEIQKIKMVNNKRIGAVCFIRFVLNDKFILVADDHQIMVFSITGMGEIREFHIREDIILYISGVYNYREKQVLMASQRGNIYVLNIENMKCTCINMSSFSAISDIKCVFDHYAIILGYSKEVQIWDMLEKKCIHQLYFENEEICKCACTQNSDKIVFASEKGKIFIFDKETLKFDKKYITERYVKSIEFDQSGRYIVIVSILLNQTMQISVYDIQTDQVQTLKFDFWAEHSCFFPDEKNLLITECSDGKGKQVNIASKDVVKTLSGKSHSYNEENYYDRIIQKFCINSEWDIGKYFKEETKITCGIYNGNERQLYLGDTGGYIKVLEADSDRCIAMLKCAKESIDSIVFSSDKELFIGISKGWNTLFSEAPIKIYNSGTFRCEYKIKNVRKRAKSSIVFEDDNFNIWMGDYDGVIEIWEYQEKNERAQQNYRDNKNLKTFCNKVRSWLCTKILDDSRIGWWLNRKIIHYYFEDYYLVKTIPFVSGLLIENARFTNLHPKSTLTPDTMEILESYGAIIK